MQFFYHSKPKKNTDNNIAKHSRTKTNDNTDDRHSISTTNNPVISPEFQPSKQQNAMENWRKNEQVLK